MYAESKQGSEATDLSEHRDLGSPEGREQFAGHYDSVVGATTMLVESHDDVDVIAMAHHGSVSKDRRKRIEEQLKRGQLRCVVATSSLELGIDMGSVDLVIRVAAPLSIASGLQRVGRADHNVGGVSHAFVLPHNPTADHWHNSQHGMYAGRGYKNHYECPAILWMCSHSRPLRPRPWEIFLRMIGTTACVVPRLSEISIGPCSMRLSA